LFEFLKKRKIWLVYIPLTIYWLVLFTATSIPVEKLPSIGLSDKVNHLMAYFVLSFLFYLALLFQGKSKFLFDNAPLATLIICSFYGIADEIHQILIPGRSAEVLDWIADALGAVLGVLLVSYIKYRLKYKPEFVQN
jgi:VanZ family protein